MVPSAHWPRPKILEQVSNGDKHQAAEIAELIE